MAIDSEQVWKDEFKKLPQVSSSTKDGMNNLADFVAARVKNMKVGSPVTGNSSFNFNRGVFVSALENLQPVQDPSGLIAIATAWQNAVLASSMTVSAGSFVGASTPATLFSVVQLTTVMPPSVVGAYGILLGNLVALQPTKDESMLPVYLRNAFLMLQYMVTGLNSLAPTPAPLVANAIVE